VTPGLFGVYVFLSCGTVTSNPKVDYYVIKNQEYDLLWIYRCGVRGGLLTKKMRYLSFKVTLDVRHRRGVRIVIVVVVGVC